MRKDKKVAQIVVCELMLITNGIMLIDILAGNEYPIECSLVMSSNNSLYRAI